MTRSDAGPLPHGARLELARWADARLSELVERACAEIATRIPEYYGDLDDHAVHLDELSSSVRQNLRHLVRAIAEPDGAFDPEAATTTGRRRAHQGVPLPEVLRAYRISFATLWDALVDHVRRLRRTSTTDALIETASLTWRFTDAHAVALTEAFRAATAELLLAEQRRRSAIVEALLTGRPGPASGPGEAAALLGFPAGNELVVVAAETLGLAGESLPQVEPELARRGIVSAWRLTPAQQLGVVSFHPDQYEALLDVLNATALARTGVSPRFGNLSGTTRAHQLARAACVGLPPGEPGIRVFDDSPLAALVVSDSVEGRRLAREVLGPVLQQAPADRDVLLSTLDVYLDAGGSAEDAADVLFCHPNTVRNRLRRIQELTGRSLTEPRDLAELTTAAYALRFDGTAPAAGSDLALHAGE